MALPAALIPLLIGYIIAGGLDPLVRLGDNYFGGATQNDPSLGDFAIPVGAGVAGAAFPAVGPWVTGMVGSAANLLFSPPSNPVQSTTTTFRNPNGSQVSEPQVRVPQAQTQAKAPTMGASGASTSPTDYLSWTTYADKLGINPVQSPLLSVVSSPTVRKASNVIAPTSTMRVPSVSSIQTGNPFQNVFR